MSQIAPNQDEYFEILRNSYDKLTSNYMSLSEENKTLEYTLKAQKQKHQKELRDQKGYYQSITAEQSNKITELQALCRNLQQEEIVQNKKQFRKYVEGINEKQVQLSNLKRQLHTQKNRIASLEQEVNNLSNIKENYQIFVLKTTDQIKNNVKEAYAFIDDMENEKMVMESKYRQMNEKTVLIHNQLLQLEGQKNNAQENYNKIKQLYKKSKDQYLECKFELEKQREAAKNHLIFGRSEAIENDTELLIMKQFENVINLNEILVNYEECLKQTSEFADLHKEILEENTALKLRINELSNEIDEMRLRSPQEHDSLLKQNEPSLFEYLQSKKNQVREFEVHIQKIEAYMEQKDEKINAILNALTQKGLECSCGKQKFLDETLYKYEQLKKRYDFIVESNQKKKEEKSRYEAKLEEFHKIIKQLFGKKKKGCFSLNNKCAHCYAIFEKGATHYQCEDCKKKFHEFYCYDKHECDLFNMQDSKSNYSSNKKI